MRIATFGQEPSRIARSGIGSELDLFASLFDKRLFASQQFVFNAGERD
jgi:hypothetical protein